MTLHPMLLYPSAAAPLQMNLELTNDCHCRLGSASAELDPAIPGLVLMWIQTPQHSASQHSVLFHLPAQSKLMSPPTLMGVSYMPVTSLHSRECQLQLPLDGSCMQILLGSGCSCLPLLAVYPGLLEITRTATVVGKQTMRRAQDIVLC